MAKVINSWRENWKCALCGAEHTGWGCNPAPLLDYNSALVCSECNKFVVSFRFLKRAMGEEDTYKTIDRAEYLRIKKYAKKHPYVRGQVQYLDQFFKGTKIDKITDSIDYGDLVEETELEGIA